VRALVYQLIVIAGVLSLGWLLVADTLENMRLRGLHSGFAFLFQPAGFAIGESLFDFQPTQPYWRAFVVGLANTLRVALLGIALSTALGVLIGIGRLSRNFLVRTACAAYVEVFRNVPVLLQLLTCYFVLTEMLPPASEAIAIGAGILLSKSGLAFPRPLWSYGYVLAAAGLAAGAVAAFAYRRRLPTRFQRTGRASAQLVPMLGIVFGSTLLGWLAGGAPHALDMPVRNEFNIAGGAALSPEFLAVWIGLAIYTAAFVAEIVRAGIQSVSWGQIEAASALGLSRRQQLRLVLLPQAMRLIVPAMTNQYLNLTKNSSLAVAVGYADLVSISNTTLNQTGRAVECIAILMAVYLTLSLITSALMNFYNARIAITER
jgi:general L-amino acid transport system permease protein